MSGYDTWKPNKTEEIKLKKLNWFLNKFLTILQMFFEGLKEGQLIILGSYSKK